MSYKLGPRRFFTPIALSLLHITLVSAVALKNYTITVPEGTSNHGDSHLLCTPAGWTDVATFFVGSYLAHAFTVVGFPGESTWAKIKVVASALLFPTSGIFRAVIVIMTFARWGETNLRKAAKARALCMLIRDPKTWKPRAGDAATDSIFQTKGEAAASDQDGSSGVEVRVFDAPWGTLKSDDDTCIVHPKFTIHGTSKLPDGYRWAYVGRDAEFEEEPPSVEPTKLSSRSNTISSIIAVGQACYAIYTLYQTKGDQLTRYGYAAFGLTVAPFASMTILNLIANYMAPSYDGIFMVSSSVMEEAGKRPGFFVNGVVATLKESSDAKLETEAGSCTWPHVASFEGGDANEGLSVVVRPKDESGPKPMREQHFSILTAPEEVDVLLVANDSNAGKEPHEHIGLVSCDDEAGPGREAALYTHANTPVVWVPSCPQPARLPKAEQRTHTILPPKKKGKAKLNFKTEPGDPFDISWLWVLALMFLPLAIVGGVSKFQPGDSTTPERAWTMSWLVICTVAGPLVGYANDLEGYINAGEQNAAFFLYVIVLGAPAIGAYVMVGKMFYEYGSCIELN